MYAIALQAPHRLDAAGIAAVARRANDLLAGEAIVGPEVVEMVHALAEEVLGGELNQWLAVDPRQALMAHRSTVEAQEAVRSPGDRDARNRLRLALDQLVDALLRIDEQQAFSEDLPAKQVVRQLVDAAGVSQKDVAELLGVDLRKLQRWLSDATANQPEGDEARRVRTVAKLVARLRHVYTSPGVIEWFSWSQPDLGDATPAQLLRDVSRTPDLLRLANAVSSTTLT